MVQWGISYYCRSHINTFKKIHFFGIHSKCLVAEQKPDGCSSSLETLVWLQNWTSDCDATTMLRPVMCSGSDSWNTRTSRGLCRVTSSCVDAVVLLLQAEAALSSIWLLTQYCRLYIYSEKYKMCPSDHFGANEKRIYLSCTEKLCWWKLSIILQSNSNLSRFSWWF